MFLFFQVILPIMAVFGAGFILQRIRALDIRSVSAVSIYIFLPALVFTTLYEATFDKGYTIIVVFAFVLLFLMIVINKILARIFKWSKPVESASILTSAFMNGGNYGVPVIIFSLDSSAVPYAIFFMVLQSVIMNSFGIYYASRGEAGMARAVSTIFKMPTTYAVLLAVLFQKMSWEISESIFTTLSMVGGAAIPIVMVMLGMQLASITSLKFNWQVLTSAVIVRMIISPIIAVGFISLVDVDPIIAAVILIIASMPSAATTTMFAIEFDAEPELVSSITLVTTLISVVSLTILLNVII